MEECGKVELLGDWIASVLSGLDHDTGRLWRALASHEAKNLANAYMLELSEEEKHARQRKDWKGLKAAFTRAKREFHEKSNRAKNAALYVDIVDGNLATPRDRITVEMVAEIAKQNERYLGLIQSRLKISFKWGSEPVEAGELIRQFTERIEQLEKAMPDDPQKVMDVVLDEMRSALLAKKKGKEVGRGEQ
jgi:AbiV family abortive infection protein